MTTASILQAFPKVGPVSRHCSGQNGRELSDPIGRGGEVLWNLNFAYGKVPTTVVPRYLWYSLIDVTSSASSSWTQNLSDLSRLSCAIKTALLAGWLCVFASPLRLACKTVCKLLYFE